MDKQLKLTPSMVIRRGHYLYFLYYWIYCHINDYRIASKNLNHTILNDSPDAFPVQCISYQYIKELLKCYNFSDNDVFVDVGCAWGRLIGYMRLHTPVKKFYGVDLNSEVAEFAQKIFKNDDRVTIISGNILENLPMDGTIFYLFNPFAANVLDSFLSCIEEKMDHSIKILYLYPLYKEIFFTHTDKWHLLETKMLKPRWLGEIEMCIYEFNP